MTDTNDDPLRKEMALEALGGTEATPTREELIRRETEVLRKIREAEASRLPQAGADGQRYRIEHDGFVGTVIGSYTRLDGEAGVVMQQDGTTVVHVYRKKWLVPVQTGAAPNDAVTRLRHDVRTAWMTGVPNYRELYDEALYAVLGITCLQDLYGESSVASPAPSDAAVQSKDPK